MRVWMLAAAQVLLMPAQTWAGGRCDLDRVIGYQVMAAKPISGYVQNGVRRPGYEGCETDRTIVFSDNTGLRCNEVVRQRTDELPTAYVFANPSGAVKMCVEGELIDMTRSN